MSKKAFSAGPFNSPVMPSERSSQCNSSNLSKEDFTLSEEKESEKHLEFNGQLTLQIPKSLHRKLWESAILEGVSLEQYIIYKLT